MKKKSVLMPAKGLFYGYLVPLLTIGLFVVLTALSVFVFYYQARAETAELIATQVTKLATVFERINATCTIVSFDNQKNPINFLTIKKGGFVGSEVGSMNLAHPEKWQGPYVCNNPVIQGKEYQVVRTQQGYFVTPGDGVRLPNGKVVGTDIRLDEHADMRSLMHDEQGLMSKGKPLAAPFSVGTKTTLNPSITPDWADELV
jgi:hypothetical protein